MSDTHGFLDDSILKHFVYCDEIWHAGDFGNIELANKIAFAKPLRGVYGNIDGQDIRSHYKEVLKFTCENVRVLIIHIGGYPKKYTTLARKEMADYNPQLFISGHSHILKVMYDDQNKCLHMNPGAAGNQGWHRVKTIIRFSIDGAEIKDCEVIELGIR